MLTPEKGRYWLSASSSTLTVTDTPAVQEAVARYVDEQNSIMNRQVALNVQVLSVSNTETNSSVWTGTLFINRYIPPEQR